MLRSDQSIEQGTCRDVITAGSLGSREQILTGALEARAVLRCFGVALHETYHVVNGINAPTSRWLYSESPATLQTFSFNTPVGVDDKSQCGRVAYSNFHIASGSGGGMTYPDECPPGPMTPQEKVMEFMLLDLASCVQTDTVPPEPPPTVK